MTVFDFDKQIDSKIVKRGHKYFLDDLVEELDDSEEHCYSAVVRGSSDYEVSIELNDAGEIVRQQCDCPFMGGPVCKHAVAVLFEVRRVVRDSDGATVPPDVAELTEIRRRIARLSAAELRELFVDAAGRRKDFRELLLWELGKRS